MNDDDASWVCLLCLFPPALLAFIIIDLIVYVATGREKDLLDILQERKKRKNIDRREILST